MTGFGLTRILRGNGRTDTESRITFPVGKVSFTKVKDNRLCQRTKGGMKLERKNGK